MKALRGARGQVGAPTPRIYSSLPLLPYVSHSFGLHTCLVGEANGGGISDTHA
jgi:hypothetical protein